MGGTVLDEAGSPVVVNIEQPRWDQVWSQSHIFLFLAKLFFFFWIWCANWRHYFNFKDMSPSLVKNIKLNPQKMATRKGARNQILGSSDSKKSTPIRETPFSSVLPSNSRLGLSPLNRFLSWHSTLQGPFFNLAWCGMLCARRGGPRTRGHHQEQMVQTLIVHLLKTHLFLSIAQSRFVLAVLDSVLGPLRLVP